MKQWYVIHTQAGLENKVKGSLEQRVQVLEMDNLISRIFIPTEDVAEIRGGQKKVTARKFFPGYVLVEMELNDKTWYLVKNTPGVAGFVGAGAKPIPLEKNEIENILKATEEKKTKPVPKVVFEQGDAIKVVEGPFTNFNGVVDEVNPEKGKLRVMVSIFGRSTPVELEYWQVEKL